MSVRVPQLIAVSLLMFVSVSANAIPQSTLTIEKECIGEFCDDWAGQEVLFDFSVLFNYSDGSGLVDETKTFSLGFGESEVFNGQRQDTIFEITEFDAFNETFFLSQIVTIGASVNNVDCTFTPGNDCTLGVGPTTIGTPVAIEMIWSNQPLAAPVPVPATLALFGLGLAGLGWSRRKA